MREEIINRIKKHNIYVKELIHECSNKKRLNEKNILQIAEAIQFHRRMIKNYKYILSQFF